MDPRPEAEHEHEHARRPPTAAEARALAHPLRMRILFACRREARTNKELATLLDTTPGTIHYHLKPLVEEGFLRPEEPRPGPRGSTEQPYRSTGKSWEVGGTPETGRTLREVAAAEVLAIPDEDEFAGARIGLTLTSDEVDELRRAIETLIEDAARRSRTGPDSPDTVATDQPLEDVTLFAVLYRSHGSDRPNA